MNTKINLSLLLNVLCISAVIYMLTTSSNNKTAFFLNAAVYNEFTYKKELEMDLEQIQNAAQKTMDSLQLDLQVAENYMVSGTPTEDDKVMFERKRQTFYMTQKQVEEAYALKVQESYNLIWDRINGYVKEYGETNGYDYIFGANGDGTVMYADGSEDITSDITEFVNQRYAGE